MPTATKRVPFQTMSLRVCRSRVRYRPVIPVIAVHDRAAVPDSHKASPVPRYCAERILRSAFACSVHVSPSLLFMDDFRAEVRHLFARDRNAVRATQSEHREESLAAGLAWSVEPWESPGMRWVDCLDVHRTWLDRHRLDATQCAIVRVRGESMEPTLNDGSTILINCAQRRRRSGRLFAVRADDGLVVRRASARTRAAAGCLSATTLTGSRDRGP